MASSAGAQLATNNASPRELPVPVCRAPKTAGRPKQLEHTLNQLMDCLYNHVVKGHVSCNSVSRENV